MIINVSECSVSLLWISGAPTPTFLRLEMAVTEPRVRVLGDLGVSFAASCHGSFQEYYENKEGFEFSVGCMNFIELLCAYVD